MREKLRSTASIKVSPLKRQPDFYIKMMPSQMLCSDASSRVVFVVIVCLFRASALVVGPIGVSRQCTVRIV
mgnify:CR=1 FL=1